MSAKVIAGIILVILIVVILFGNTAYQMGKKAEKATQYPKAWICTALDPSDPLMDCTEIRPY